MLLIAGVKLLLQRPAPVLFGPVLALCFLALPVTGDAPRKLQTASTDYRVMALTYAWQARNAISPLSPAS
ncbi:hypothetical protein ACQX14_12200, partial [Corynebacterium diphtheriae]